MTIPRLDGSSDPTNSDEQNQETPSILDEFRQGPSMLFADSIFAGPGRRVAIAQRAFEMGTAAKQAGYAAESSALYIACARISLAAEEIRTALVNSHEKPTIGRGEVYKQIVRAFDGLSRISLLPDDDAGYWQYLLAQVSAGLAPVAVAPFFPEPDRSVVAQALPRLAHVLSTCVPGELSLETLQSLINESSFEPRTSTRLIARLAHVELLGDLPRSAWKRLMIVNGLTDLTEGDRFYIYVLMLAAARRATDPRIYMQCAADLTEHINQRRNRFRSADGRSWEMREIEESLYDSLQVWEHRIQSGDDLWLIAELTKARVLLDEIEQHYNRAYEPGQNRSQPRAVGTRREPTVEGIRKAPGTGPWLRDMSESELRQLQNLSYYPMKPFGLHGFELSLRTSGLPHNDREELLRLEATQPADVTRFDGSAPIADLRSIRDALRHDELIVEYLIPRSPLTPNREYWILVTDSKKTIGCCGYLGSRYPSSMHLHFGDTGQVFERGPLSHTAVKTRAAILDESDDSDNPPLLKRLFDRFRGRSGFAGRFLKRLFKMMIGPVIEAGYEPERFSKWIIIPHGPLHLLPFAAFIDDRGRHLIERVSVVAAPSANTWLRMVQRQSRVSKKILTVGNPSDSKLPDAQTEVEGIAPILRRTRDDWDAVLLTGVKAAVHRVTQEMDNSGIIHFATHADVDWHDPRDGHGLRLAADQVSPAHLYAGDVRRMHLEHTQLAFLNACNATVCRYGAGDEPLGLVGAFIVAGVGNVVGGLWPIEDRAARLFAWDFYGSLTGTDLAGAYRGAAMSAIRDRRPLADWAGVQFVGPGRSRV